MMLIKWKKNIVNFWKKIKCYENCNESSKVTCKITGRLKNIESDAVQILKETKFWLKFYRNTNKKMHTTSKRQQVIGKLVLI